MTIHSLIQEFTEKSKRTLPITPLEIKLTISVLKCIYPELQKKYS